MIRKKFVFYLLILLVSFGVIFVGFIANPNTPNKFSVHYTKDRGKLQSQLAEQGEAIDRQVNQQIVQLRTKEKELETVKGQSSEVGNLFLEISEIQRKSGNWSFHVPSLLISLEQSAINSGIDIAIDWELLSGATTLTETTPLDGTEEITEGIVDVTEGELVEEITEPIVPDPIERPNRQGLTGSEEIRSRIALAKVEVSGDYHAITNYIKEIESIDFISVEDLSFEHIENTLVGYYTMNIFYFE